MRHRPILPAVAPLNLAPRAAPHINDVLLRPADFTLWKQVRKPPGCPQSVRLQNHHSCLQGRSLASSTPIASAGQTDSGGDRGARLRSRFRGRRRDPSFRQRVLVAYEYQCAVCGLDLRICGITIALEAAHVRWHQAGARIMRVMVSPSVSCTTSIRPRRVDRNYPGRRPCVRSGEWHHRFSATNR